MPPIEGNQVGRRRRGREAALEVNARAAPSQALGSASTARVIRFCLGLRTKPLGTSSAPPLLPSVTTVGMLVDSSGELHSFRKPRHTEDTYPL
jgi:hypothetical protein